MIEQSVNKGSRGRLGQGCFLPQSERDLIAPIVISHKRDLILS